MENLEPIKEQKISSSTKTDNKTDDKVISISGGEVPATASTRGKQKAHKSRNFIGVLYYDKNDIPAVIRASEKCVENRLLKSFACIKHDRDRYLAEDAREYNRLHKDDDDFIEVHEGDLKPCHEHFIWTTYDPLSSNAVAGRLNFPKQDRHFVRTATSREASVRYLTHKDNPEKFQYDESLIKGTLYSTEAVYADDTEAVDATIDHIAIDGMTLREASEALGAELFVKNKTMLCRARSHYLERNAPMPKVRINIYISGKDTVLNSGTGKSTLAKFIAGLLGGKEDVYTVSCGKVALDAYDGENIILWDDVRPDDMVKRFGVGGVISILQPHPDKTPIDVKYSRTVPVNEFNVFTCPWTIDDFARIITTHYDKHGRVDLEHSEDITQILRRFPLWLTVEKHAFEIYINLGIMGMGKFTEFAKFRREACDLTKCAELSDDDKKLMTPVITEGVSEAIDKVKEHLDAEVLIEDLPYGSHIDYDITDNSNKIRL